MTNNKKKQPNALLTFAGEQDCNALSIVCRALAAKAREVLNG